MGLGVGRAGRGGGEEEGRLPSESGSPVAPEEEEEDDEGKLGEASGGLDVWEELGEGGDWTKAIPAYLALRSPVTLFKLNLCRIYYFTDEELRY